MRCTIRCSESGSYFPETQQDLALIVHILCGAVRERVCDQQSHALCSATRTPTTSLGLYYLMQDADEETGGKS